ncbi:MAG: hypothetical protein R6U32_05465 [Candidatus Woesearchaeota archaeon]
MAKRGVKETKAIVLLAVLFLSIILLPSAFAQEDKNITNEDAENALNSMNETMHSMIEDGFNVNRINDTLRESLKMYRAQKVLEKEGEKPDYSSILEAHDDVIGMKDEAYHAKDLLYVAEQAYKSLRDKAEEHDTNISEAESLFESARQEFNDERYEKAAELAEQAEKKAIEKEASLTTVSLFYDTVTGSIKDFFVENYKIIIASVIGFLLALFIFWYQLKRMMLKMKLKRLLVEKDTLKKVIQRTQHDYFEKNRISETDYNLKTQKFTEMMRDIDRRIPLIREQLARIKKDDKIESNKEVE